MKTTIKRIGPLTLVTLITERGIKVTGAYMESFVPEMQAALGATLSRDPGSIESRLEKVFGSKTMSQRILDVYFKKYGHNSIGDMGTLIFSVEGLSMNGAFNLLEHQLFNGQEASTRYLDFGEMGFISVNEEIDALSQESMDLYKQILKSEIEHNINVLGMDKKDAEPKAFDVAGAFLPISARTNVFWTGSIRTYIDKIRELRSMGSEEKEIGAAMSQIFDEICPNSQRDLGEDSYEDKIKFKGQLKDSAEQLFRNCPDKILDFGAFNTTYFKFAMANVKKVLDIHGLGIFGILTSVFEFDFRSSRDIHRHRAFFLNTVLNYKPLGFEDHYESQVSDSSLRKSISDLEKKSMKAYSVLGENAKYGMPMAMKFQYVMSGTLNAWLYFTNLRSGPKVHPTVIKLAQKVGITIEEELKIKDIYQRGGADYGIRSGDANKV